MLQSPDPWLLSDDELAFRNSVLAHASQFTAQASISEPATRQEIDRVVDELREADLMGLTLPNEYGGKQKARIQAVIALECVARFSFTHAEVLQVAVNGPAYAIACLGNTALKEYCLPKAANGEWLIGIAVTEENAGSSLGDISCTVSSDQQRMVLNGHKSFTTGGSLFNAFEVVCRFGASGTKGIGSVIVTDTCPGFSVQKTFEKIGSNVIPEARISFDNCVIEDWQILIDGRDCSTTGFKTFIRSYNQMRLGIAAICLGIAYRGLDQIVQFLNQRIQFGKPLSAFQGLRWRVAELFTEFVKAKLLTYQAARTEDGLGFPDPVLTAMAKLAATESAVKVFDAAMQLMGSRGIVKDSLAAKGFLDVRPWTIAGGTTEMMLEYIGGTLLSGK